MAHLRGQEVGAGCWQEATISPYMGLSSGLLECPYNMTADFPKSNKYKRKGGGKLSVFIT